MQKMTSALTGLRSASAFAREYLHQGRTNKCLLGIDFGSWKTGVALYDPAVSLRRCEELVTLKAQEHLVAVPKEMQIARRVRDLAKQRACFGIVIGWPQAHVGENNHTERLVTAFATALVAVGTELPLTLWNERYSTVAARDALVAARGSRPPRSRKPTFSASEVQLIDQIAARLLLEDFVEALLLPASAT